ncbi:hypothetical protein [Fimbriiglobus ruber]|uniref:Uncharacterized protein n=1 Tax=Fimbriiglobus ruber TaxID=1908690 RepID=A0A225DXE0_9BACT|nr:hypothetical protein [Fimbriiglobus ruber]OWK44244.1 hypothetical protein FRUB_02176 [Fimbriiglobus ruber]
MFARQWSHVALFRAWDQNREPPHVWQFRGCRGRQLAHGPSGHRPHRQNATPAGVLRTTTFARHVGQSFRWRIWGRATSFWSVH